MAVGRVVGSPPPSPLRGKVPICLEWEGECRERPEGGDTRQARGERDGNGQLPPQASRPLVFEFAVPLILQHTSADLRAAREFWPFEGPQATYSVDRYWLGSDPETLATNLNSLARLFHRGFERRDPHGFFPRVLSAAGIVAKTWANHEINHSLDDPGGDSENFVVIGFDNKRPGDEENYVLPDLWNSVSGLGGTQVARRLHGHYLTRYGTNFADTAGYFFAGLDLGVQYAVDHFEREEDRAWGDNHLEVDIEAFRDGLHAANPLYQISEWKLRAAVLVQALDPMGLQAGWRTIQGLRDGLQCDLASPATATTVCKPFPEVNFFYPLGEAVGFHPTTAAHLGPEGVEFEGGTYMRIHTSERRFIASRLYGSGGSGWNGRFGGGGVELQGIPLGNLPLYANLGVHYRHRDHREIPNRYAGDEGLERYGPSEHAGNFAYNAGLEAYLYRDRLGVKVEFSHKDPGQFGSSTIEAVDRATASVLFSF